MNPRTRNFLIWLTAFGLILTLSALVGSAILAGTDGHFVYILDDPYIHLAMARNFVESGIWGVTRYEFSSGSSSVLWVLILALAELVTDHTALVPLFINLALAAVMVAVSQFYLQKHMRSTWRIILTLVVVMLGMPLITLVFLGMEHILQSIVAVLFVFAGAHYVTQTNSDPGSRPTATGEVATLVLLAALSTAIRYEGLFQITAVGLYLVLRKRFAVAALVGVAGILTPILYGAYSMSHGWPALPTPILLKGTLSSLLNIQSPADFARALEYLIQEKYIKHIHMPVLIVIGTIFYIRNRRKGANPFSLPQTLLGMYLLVAVQHLHFAGLGWYMRYEAYLVALGCLILALHWFGDFAETTDGDEIQTSNNQSGGRYIWARRAVMALLLVCAVRLGFSLGWRALVSVAGLPDSAREIYTQQYQSAQFLNRYYTGQAIAANDIGAINYYSDIQCLDLFGLANHRVATLRKNKNFNTEAVRTLTADAGVRIAIVYDAWFEKAGGLPAEWRKAGEWTIPENTTVAQDTVAIYALAEDYDVVVRQLKEFGETMPATIQQNVPYRP